MHCTNCGNEIPESVKFCPKCGTPTKPLEEIVQPEHSGMATVAMSLGIVGVVTLCLGIGVIFGITALILGIIALRKIKKSNGMLTGNSYAITGIVTGGITVLTIPIIAVLVAIAIPNFKAGQSRAKFISAKADQRMLATALEAYYVDNNIYPFPDMDSAGKSIVPHILTTPLAYLTSLPKDQHKNGGQGYYEYGCDTTLGWIVTSYGPDNMDGNSGTPGGKPLDESLAWSDKALGFELSSSPLTYDPTNGSKSPGDIWRRGP